MYVGNTADKDFVEVTGAVTGHYEVIEHRPDGTIVLGPDTSAAAISERLGTRPMTTDEFEQHFGDLPHGEH